MLFNTLEYIVFLFSLVGIFYAIPSKKRYLLLLLASYYFYMAWNPFYIFLIIISSLIDFYAAKFIEKSDKKDYRKRILKLSIFSNIGILVFFKYYNFFAMNINEIYSSGDYLLIAYHSFLLPVGISFYTFQSMSYTIDVYRKKLVAEQNFAYLALYVSFFPQLIAGPIERGSHLIKQFKGQFDFNAEEFKKGLTIILWGMFLKVVIADRIALFVDPVYANYQNFSGFEIFISTLFFSVQIYCDFFGYSLIAIGTALLFNIVLIDNFKRPYLAANIHEFWNRWHISLSTWFRDYIYISLGGNRVYRWRIYFNIVIVFFVSGLWHGANWTFIVWGLSHSLFYLIYHYSKKAFPFIHRQSRLIKIVITNLAILISWVFFRANTLSDALLMIKKSILDFSSFDLKQLLQIDFNNFIFTLLFISLFFAVELMEEKHKKYWYQILNGKVKLLSISLICLGIAFFGIFDGLDFIYFQF